MLSVTLDIGDSLIKLHKTNLASDRTSCRSPRPNQSRVPAASLSRRFEQQFEMVACPGFEPTWIVIFPRFGSTAVDFGEAGIGSP